MLETMSISGSIGAKSFTAEHVNVSAVSLLPFRAPNSDPQWETLRVGLLWPWRKEAEMERECWKLKVGGKARNKEPNKQTNKQTNNKQTNKQTNSANINNQTKQTNTQSKGEEKRTSRQTSRQASKQTRKKIVTHLRVCVHIK